MDLIPRLVERQQQLRAAELYAAECRGVIRGLRMHSRRHPALEEAEAQERAAEQHTEALRGAVQELEAQIAEIRAARAAEAAPTEG